MWMCDEPNIHMGFKSVNKTLYTKEMVSPNERKVLVVIHDEKYVSLLLLFTVECMNYFVCVNSKGYIYAAFCLCSD